jgi:hypothetical protein
MVPPLTSTLSMDEDVNHILSAVSQRLLLFNLLRKQELSDKACEIVFSGFDYIARNSCNAMPAFAGFLSCLYIARFYAVFRKSVKLGVIARMSDGEILISDAEARLFRRFKGCLDCLNQLLPKMRFDSYLLRRRGHEFLFAYCF